MGRNQLFLIFANNSRSKRNKKNPTHAFIDIGKQERCAKSQQKKLSCRVVGARRSFQIFRQNIWFLENNMALSKFLYGVLQKLQYYQIIIKSVHKKQFYFNHASHLNINVKIDNDDFILFNVVNFNVDKDNVVKRCFDVV